MLNIYKYIRVSVYILICAYAAATQVVPCGIDLRDTKTQAPMQRARNVMMIDVRWVIGTCNTLSYVYVRASEWALKLHTYINVGTCTSLASRVCDLCASSFCTAASMWYMYTSNLSAAYYTLCWCLKFNYCAHGSHHNVTKQDCRR
jgi:hypothetical protein